MAKQLANSFTRSLVLVLLISLLLSFSEMPMAEAKVCQKRSKTWSGVCLNTGNCNRQCRNWEGARSGACHRQGFGFACFCYFKC
ncbi:defensin-like protein 1 [Punica granatum]|uniref:Knottins-like domain-containing protein n=2 Tax=Punica granatum TaxID=22663 RepID=A0A218X7B8_PUNGR|nr:defensin-like protein 1 [Punica granatum]OWM80857.1 hypothetical protein CDL15_Pgr006888 [Punica granatum]PKI35154.1 hypothetical protein CRG98_044429 [Punica granatum]